MHDLRLILQNPEAFDEGLRKRGLKPLSAEIQALDQTRRKAVQEAQAALERRNSLSKEIGQAKAAKDEQRAAQLMAEVADLKKRLTDLGMAERGAIKAITDKLVCIPNTPARDVPFGTDETDNVLKSSFGSPKKLTNPQDHVSLGEGLGLMDFETAAKISGARFVILKGALARLERALGQYMLDTHTTTKHGYTEVNPPLLVRDDAMFGTAQLPKFEDDQFFVGEMGRTRSFFQEVKLFKSDLKNDQKFIDSLDDKDSRWGARYRLIKANLQIIENSRKTYRKWLIPTAEVPLTNMFRETVLEKDALLNPLRFTALTHCFRAEAGAAGRDTRGMIRQHQFAKVELVSITTPEQSAAEHEHMLECAERILQGLELPYRVMTLCTGDMGFAAQKTYDIEVWLPSQNTYREISSCSNCGDFQARRMEARYRDADGKPRYVHTLNGSGVAVGRALVAVMENYQNEDRSITIPTVLVPYMGGLTRIEKAS